MRARSKSTVCNPWALYVACGIETAGGDFIRWLSPNEIELHITAATPGDQIRVITSRVPEPASMALLALAFAATRRRQRCISSVR